MKNKRNFYGLSALLCLGAFLVWTLVLCQVDLQPIGPNGSTVGLATLNGWVHNTIGVHWWLYHLTDWFSLIPIGIYLIFGGMGLTQLLKHKRLARVDFDLLALGGFYVVVFGVYALFEVITINYRPVLINGILEGSYPSSTTLLVMCILPTAILQANRRIQSFPLRRRTAITLILFLVFMVMARLLSGVHWVTDIIGGGLLSAALVLAYMWSLCLPNAKAGK